MIHTFVLQMSAKVRLASSFTFRLNPNLSMNILSINTFTTKLLTKLLSDLYIDLKKFGSKIINRIFFHRKNVFHTKIFSINNFANKLLSIKDYFVNGPQ